MVEQGWPRAKALSELDRFGFHRIWRNLRDLAETLDADEIRRSISKTRPRTSE
jgi:hypothetical protein